MSPNSSAVLKMTSLVLKCAYWKSIPALANVVKSTIYFCKRLCSGLTFSLLPSAHLILWQTCEVSKYFRHHRFTENLLKVMSKVFPREENPGLLIILCSFFCILLWRSWEAVIDMLKLWNQWPWVPGQGLSHTFCPWTNSVKSCNYCKM